MSTQKDELERVFIRTEQTLKQKRACTENFAHRQLAAMQGMLSQLRSVVSPAVIATIHHATTRGIEQIKAEQYNRKKARLQAELAAMDAVPAVDEFNPDKWIAKPEGMKS